MNRFSGAVLACFLTGSAAVANPVTDAFTSFWALGDSLSDEGNMPGLAYYYSTTDFSSFPFVRSMSGYVTGGNTYLANDEFGFDRGRFSNGPTWAEIVSDRFEDAGRATRNLAVAGSSATQSPLIQGLLLDDLDEQLDDLTGLSASFGARPLVSLWFGANDLFNAMSDGDLLDTAREAADAITDAALALAAKGVRDFIIPNLPALARTPRYALIEPDLADEAAASTAVFNARLAQNIAGLKGQGLGVIDVDAYGALNRFMDDPARYGLTDVTIPCIFPDDGAASDAGQPRQCADAQGRLYFDEVHPGYETHAYISEYVWGEVQAALTPAVPLPAGGVLLLTALGGLLLRRR